MIINTRSIEQTDTIKASQQILATKDSSEEKSITVIDEFKDEIEAGIMSTSYAQSLAKTLNNEKSCQLFETKQIAFVNSKIFSHCIGQAFLKISNDLKKTIAYIQLNKNDPKRIESIAHDIREQLLRFFNPTIDNLQFIYETLEALEITPKECTDISIEALPFLENEHESVTAIANYISVKADENLFETMQHNEGIASNHENEHPQSTKYKKLLGDCKWTVEKVHGGHRAVLTRLERFLMDTDAINYEIFDYIIRHIPKKQAPWEESEYFKPLTDRMSQTGKNNAQWYAKKTCTITAPWYRNYKNYYMEKCTTDIRIIARAFTKLHEAIPPSLKSIEKLEHTCMKIMKQSYNWKYLKDEFKADVMTWLHWEFEQLRKQAS